MKIFLLTLSLVSISLASSLKPIENSLIVYNGGVGLVHEKALLKLNKDDTEIIYKGVANTINTDSVNINLPNNIKLYSQQYRYDKLTLYKLLDAHIDKNVYYKSKRVTLLSYSENNSLVKKKNGNIIQVKNQDISFKKIPSNLLTKPSLIWNISTQEKLETKIQLDYLINNISWKSNYILYVDKSRANLSAYISVNNHSGKAYTDTELYVLAGNVNKVAQTRVKHRYDNVMTIAQSPQVVRKSHEGYHLYTIPFKVTLANNETTSLKFIDIKNIKIKKNYVANLQSPVEQRGLSEHIVSQFIEIKELNEVLPKGIIRVYSKYKNTNIFLGESKINHTPKNTKLEIKVGENFDTKVKATLIKSSKSKYRYLADITYEVTNKSDDAKEVKLHIPFSNINDSEVKSDQDFKFLNANLVEFIVTVKANSTYTFNANFIQKR